MPDEPELAALARWSTPTIYNAWEAATRAERSEARFNREVVTDYLPELGPMVGYAVTLEIEPSQPRWRRDRPTAKDDYRAYVASVPGPKVVIVKDLDGAATVGAFWGEVNTSVHRALGCVGAITDGAIRDLPEVRGLGFKHLARRLCVGHAYAYPVRWNEPVEVFGCVIRPGDLVHADLHGFLVIPEADRAGLAEAAAFLDAAERATLIPAAAAHRGPVATLPAALARANERFRERVQDRFGAKGET